MQTFVFNVQIELAGFSEPQAAGEWLEERLTASVKGSEGRIQTFDISENVLSVNYRCN